VNANPGSTLRATAVLALAGFAVHEARYALVPDAHGDPGHGYLSAVPALLAVLVGLAVGRSLVAVLARYQGGARPVRWLAATAGLLLLHAAQETAERVLAGGGPLDAGVLVVVPLCVAAGALVAFVLRGADDLLAAAAAAPPHAVRALPAPVAAGAPLVWRAPARRGALARHLAGRAPPALV